MTVNGTINGCWVAHSLAALMIADDGDAGVIGMRVSPGIVFPAHISLGMRVSPHIYH